MRIKRIVFYILALPFKILFDFPLLFVAWFDSIFRCYNSPRCVRIFFAILSFILGMILNPFVICLYILASPFILYKKCKDHY